jgi:hypothetical protein
VTCPASSVFFFYFVSKLFFTMKQKRENPRLEQL